MARVIRQPRISLCMIVRDEEAMLPACLDSVKGAVDEVIVVDTGSRDGTERVARQAGATVLQFPWVDDFAAARNHGIERATGHWVLVLDADERLAPAAAPALRRAVSGAIFDCGLLRLHEASRVDAPSADVLSGAARLSEPQLLPRLLRRTPDLAFVRPIHENVLPWLRRRGMKVAGIDADVIHLGAAASVVDSRAKSARNIRMLKARLEREPGDVEVYGYLAHEYLRARLMDDARKTVEQGWSFVSGATDDTSIHRLATARAMLKVELRDYASARETVAVARRIEGDSPDLAFFVAYAAESEAMHCTGAARAALLEEACAGYRACLSYRSRTFAQAFVVGASSWYGATRMGTVLLQLGRPVEARGVFASALEWRPGERAAALGQVEASIAAGDAGTGLAQLSPLLDGGPDGWTLAALAADAVGQTSDARLFAIRARDLAGRGFVAGHRKDVLIHLLDRLAA
jgi:glycosyltransferase involved in cell wall biosynthesis